MEIPAELYFLGFVDDLGPESSPNRKTVIQCVNMVDVYVDYYVDGVRAGNRTLEFYLGAHRKPLRELIEKSVPFPVTIDRTCCASECQSDEEVISRAVAIIQLIRMHTAAT